MISLRSLFLQHQGQTSPEPLMLEIVKARGVLLTDRNRKRYMDLISGISVSNLGHGYPSVVRAIQKQMRKYMHLMVYGEIIQSPQVQLARKLATLLPENLQMVYYVNSGSEAIEGAVKLAKRYTGRFETVSFAKAYHGSTQGALSLMGDEYFKQAFRPLVPGNKILRYNCEEDLKKISCRTAAVIVEPVQGEAGYVPAQAAWLKKLRERCNEVGALLIFDEIQTGYGRTGKLFAFEHYGVVPDVLVLAKGFGGGMPLGAFIASRDIMLCLTHNPVLGHITTFGGHPVSCAASLATLKVLLQKPYIQEVASKEALFRQYLVHPAIKQISGKGLMLAVEFESEAFNKQVIARCLEKGILTDWFLFNAQSLRLSPPLVITSEQIKKACKIILESVDEVTM
ncbi:MAG: aspartate aminotransferase family protein [Flavobacteriales bacterium]|nr:aspartate aminotransferase family protein [Flavobacteriales bacterium]